MKAMIIASISLVSLLAAPVFAQSGAFTSIEAIKSYHIANQDSSRTVTFVEGKVEQDLFGFGPATINQYFHCDDGLYRMVCPEPYSRAADLSTLTAFFQASNTEIYLDGVLIKARTAPWKQTAEIMTCYGDTSPALWGPITYYRVSSWWDDWGVVIEWRGCDWY